MVGGAHLFVEELLKIAESLGVEAVILALILAPLATELPEKVNSFFWCARARTRWPSATSAARWSSSRRSRSASASSSPSGS